MEKKTDILEHFKTAISSTIKTLSNSENVEISFGNQTIKTDKNTIRLPELEQINSKINYNQIRAIADSESLKLRFSDKKTLKFYEPSGNISKKLYQIAEKIRCEKIGSDHFKGVKNNIEQFYQERVNSLDLKSGEDKIVESFENYLRVKLFNSKNSNELEKKLKTYKKDLDIQFKKKIEELNNLTIDQAKFNSLISDLISKMSLDENLNEEEKTEEDNKENEKSDPKNQEKKSKEQKTEEQEMSVESGIPNLENETTESNKDGKN